MNNKQTPYSGKWIAFDLGTCLLKVAVFENGQPRVDTVYEPYEANDYDDGWLNDEVCQRFIKQQIAQHRPEHAVFVYPLTPRHTFVQALYRAVRPLLSGEIRFVSAPVAAIHYYRSLTGFPTKGSVAVLDLGYTHTVLNVMDVQTMRNTACRLKSKFGLKTFDEQLRNYLNQKFQTQNLTLSDAETVRKDLVVFSKTNVALPSGEMGIITKAEYQQVVDSWYGSNPVKLPTVQLVLLLGGGALIGSVVNNLLNELPKHSKYPTDMVSCLQTAQGTFHPLTAALYGALYLVKLLQNGVLPDGRLTKICRNPHCRAEMDANATDCPKCKADVEARGWYRCKACGYVVPTPFTNQITRFCSMCGKHQLEIVNPF